MPSQLVSPGQNSALLRDLEIECFSSGKNIDVDTCKDVYAKIQSILFATKSLENKESTRLDGLKIQFRDENAVFQEKLVKEESNGRLTSDLTNELDSAKERFEKVKKAETVIKYENRRIQSTNNDAKKEANVIKLLNGDVVRPVMEKKEFDLRVALEESSSYLQEVEKTRFLLDEVSKQHADLQSNYKRVLSVLDERKKHESIIMKRPNEVQNEIQLAKKKVVDVEEKLKSTREEVAESQRHMSNENNSRRRVDVINKETMNLLEDEIQKLQKLKNEHASMNKVAVMNQTKYHSLTISRVGIEIKLRETNENLRHKRNGAKLQRKQFDRIMRLYLKKKIIAERSSDAVRDLGMKLCEETGIIKEQQRICSEQFKTIEKMKNEISIKVTRLLEQRNIEGETKNELEELLFTVEDKEIEVDGWRTEVKKLSKIISVLNSQQDIQSKKTKSILNDEKNTKEMTKLKSFVVTDMKKVLHETNKRAKEFSALYEALKREKNNTLASASASSNALLEISRKVQSGNNHLQQLRQSQEEKQNVLLKEKDSHENSKSNRAILRVDKTNSYASYREKQEEAERQKNKIEKLRSIVGSLQRNITQLKARNRFLRNRSRLMADQMSHKKNEVHLLLQRANVLEETLKRGELAIEQKKDDIRTLQIQVSTISKLIQTFCASFSSL